MIYALLALYLLGVPVSAYLIACFGNFEAWSPPDRQISIGFLAVIWPFTALVWLVERSIKTIGRLGQACTRRKK